MSHSIELLTPADLNGLKEEISSMFEQIRPVLVSSMDRYLKIAEIMEFTGHGDSTVRNWIKYGKRDRFGKVYKLEAEEFAPGEYRVLRSKLVEYGKIKDCAAILPERKKKAA
jgi:predicted DNA-binding transcriptional regulator AlpA